VLTAGGWTVEGGWEEGLPEVLLSEGELDCGLLPAVCAGIEEAVEVGTVGFEHPEWSVDLRVYRLTPASDLGL
jgi:hypothetical protein